MTTPTVSDQGSAGKSSKSRAPVENRDRKQEKKSDNGDASARRPNVEELIRVVHDAKGDNEACIAIKDLACMRDTEVSIRKSCERVRVCAGRRTPTSR